MIDFAALVLGPALAVFGEPVTVTPTASQPAVAPYQARGVWSFKPVEIPLSEGGDHSTNVPALGVRLADFTVAPDQGDFFALRGKTYVAVDVTPDGQGGADVILREATLP